MNNMSLKNIVNKEYNIYSITLKIQKMITYGLIHGWKNHPLLIGIATTTNSLSPQPPVPLIPRQHHYYIIFTPKIAMGVEVTN